MTKTVRRLRALDFGKYEFEDNTLGWGATDGKHTVLMLDAHDANSLPTAASKLVYFGVSRGSEPSRKAIMVTQGKLGPFLDALEEAYHDGWTLFQAATYAADRRKA